MAGVGTERDEGEPGLHTCTSWTACTIMKKTWGSLGYAEFILGLPGLCVGSLGYKDRDLEQPGLHGCRWSKRQMGFGQPGLQDEAMRDILV